MKNEDSPFPTKKRNLLQWIIISLGPIMFAILWWMVDFDRLIENIRYIDISLFIFAILLLCSTLFIRTFRWRLLLSEGEKSPTYFSLLMMYSYANFAGVVTPGRLGEFAKAFHLENYDIPIGRAMAYVLTDRLLDVFALLLISVVSFSLIISGDRSNIIVPILVGSFLGCSIFAWIFFRGEKFDRLLYYLQTIEIGIINRALKRFSTIGRDFRTVIQRQNKNTLIASFGLTILVWGVVYLANWFIAKSLNMELSYFQIVALSSVSSLLSQLPITILGVGTRDATMILILSKYGLSKEKALALSTLFLASILLVALICAISIFSEPVRFARKERRDTATQDHKSC